MSLCNNPPVATFTPFSQLPVELRTAIWRLTFLSRTIVVEAKAGYMPPLRCLYSGLDDSKYCVGRENQRLQGIPLQFRAPLVAAFHVCQESRNLAIESYSFCFGSKHNPTPTWFNFSIDVLFFNPVQKEVLLEFFKLLNQAECSKLRYLAIPNSYVYFTRTYWEFDELHPWLPQLEGLEQLLVITDIDSKLHSNVHSSVTLYDQIHEELPLHVHEEERYVFQPPNVEKLASLEVWSTPKTKHVYGWRTCPSSRTRRLPKSSAENRIGYRRKSE